MLDGDWLRKTRAAEFDDDVGAEDGDAGGSKEMTFLGRPLGRFAGGSPDVDEDGSDCDRASNGRRDSMVGELRIVLSLPTAASP